MLVQQFAKLPLHLPAISIVWIIVLLLPLLPVAQNNLVPNSGFEDITDCQLLFGDVYKAEPWLISDLPDRTPDLYHNCADEDSFYGLPGGGCVAVFPRTGNGMVGMVNLIAEERIYARLLDTLPTDHDIYLSFWIHPEKNCNTDFGTLCYSNTQSLAISTNRDNVTYRALTPDTIMDNVNTWTQLENCYQAMGDEKYIFLGNYQLASQTQIYCDNYEDINYAYNYVDDIIVSPFDVVPDTLIICENEVFDFDIQFFDLPVSWNDGYTGGQRTIDESGTFIVFAETSVCMLQDTTVVIKIPDDESLLTLDICDQATWLLTAPVIALWDNGDINTSRLINRPGSYWADLLVDCGEEQITYVYEVTEINCGIDAFVPNVFSPNGDGINDEMIFYFNTSFAYEGKLTIFDRWGNQLFQKASDSMSAPLTWNGTSRGKRLDTGVYLWMYRYRSSGDNRERVLSGDVTLLR